MAKAAPSSRAMRPSRRRLLLLTCLVAPTAAQSGVVGAGLCRNMYYQVPWDTLDYEGVIPLGICVLERVRADGGAAGRAGHVRRLRVQAGDRRRAELVRRVLRHRSGPTAEPSHGWWRTDAHDDGKHDLIFREPEGPGVRTRARLQRHVLHLPRLLAAAAVAAAAGARVAERRVPPERAAVPRRAQVALGGGRRLLHAVVPAGT